MHAHHLQVLILAAALVGCGSASQSPTAHDTPPTTLPDAGDGAVAVAHDPEAARPADPASAPDDAAAAAHPAVDDAGAAKATSAVERVALLTPGGPLLVDVRLTVDGRPHTAAFDELVQQVLDAGRSADNGPPTWKRLAANREFLDTALSNPPAAGSREMRSLIERHDVNRDGVIQAGEAASLLGHDAGAAARPFGVRSSRAYLAIPHANSQLWQLLDADGDGRLSGQEMRRAPQQLLALDANDQRLITPANLASLREQLEAAGGRRGAASSGGHYAAIHLEAELDADRLLYLLCDLYAAGHNLTADSFRDLGQLFAALDTNGDGRLQVAELARLTAIEPHLQVEVRFDQSDAPPWPAAVELIDHVPEVTVLAQPTADRMVLLLGNTRLVVCVDDLAPGGSSPQTPQQAAAMSQIRLMVHDQCDVLFEMLDANGDGVLGEREIATSAERLQELDANGDGRLSADELPSMLVVAFLRGEPPGERRFYVPAAAAPLASEVAPPPWFQHADLNGDGEISRREFVGSDEQFSMLDANQDGYLSATEAAAFEPQ